MIVKTLKHWVCGLGTSTSPVQFNVLPFAIHYNILATCRMATSPAADLYEPSPRFWHSAITVKDKIYVRGGWTQNFETESEKKKLSSTLEEFDPRKEIWSQLRLEGIPHPGLLEAACTSTGDNIFTYGGHIIHYSEDVLSRLDLNSLTFSSDRISLGPMKKAGFGLVSFGGGKLALFGGCGIPILGYVPQPGSEFIKDNSHPDGRGFTNEFHILDTSKPKSMYTVYDYIQT